MNIREKYNIQEGPNTFSLFPNKPSVNLSKWFLAGIVVALVALFCFQNYFSEEMKWALSILLVYFIVHSWYDISIRAKIQYTFDTVSDTIYKKNPLYSKKKIMKLSEAVIFVQSEMGSWHYALGAKKSQFVKNHRISEGFSSGRKSDKRQDEYEKFVLLKIDKLIQDIHQKNNELST